MFRLLRNSFEEVSNFINSFLSSVYCVRLSITGIVTGGDI
jgi:hypothetical protein